MATNDYPYTTMNSVINNGGYYSIDNTTTVTSSNICMKPKLDVLGDAHISGKLYTGGRDIGETLDKIEERLAILKPNLELESRWEQLRELRKQYLELEAEILQKEEVYRILSK